MAIYKAEGTDLLRFFYRSNTDIRLSWMQIALFEHIKVIGGWIITLSMIQTPLR